MNYADRAASGKFSHGGFKSSYGDSQNRMAGDAFFQRFQPKQAGMNRRVAQKPSDVGASYGMVNPKQQAISNYAMVANAPYEKQRQSMIDPKTGMYKEGSYKASEATPFPVY